jgi:hypothetical protein
MASTGQGRLIRSGMASPQAMRYPVRQETVNGSGLAAALGDYWWGGYPPTPTQIPYSWLSPPARWRPAPPANTAAVTRTGGETARSVNRTSVASIGERPFTATLNTTVADDPYNFASYITTFYSDPRQRMPEIALELAGRTPTECWRILSRKIGDRISITGAPNAAVQLVANPWFESGISGWTATGCTLAQSATFSRSGSFSLRLTPDGVTANSFAEDDRRTVVPGATYVVDGWLFSPGGYSAAGISVNWYRSDGSYDSTSASVSALVAGVSDHRHHTFTAPATARYGRVHPVQTGTPAVGNVLYADEVTLTGPDGTRPTWPDGVTELVIEGIAHGYGSEGGRTVAWKTAPVIGAVAGVAGPWFRLGESMTGGTDLMPF